MRLPRFERPLRHRRAFPQRRPETRVYSRVALAFLFHFWRELSFFHRFWNHQHFCQSPLVLLCSSSRSSPAPAFPRVAPPCRRWTDSLQSGQTPNTFRPTKPAKRRGSRSTTLCTIKAESVSLVYRDVFSNSQGRGKTSLLVRVYRDVWTNSQGRGNSPFWYEYGQSVGGMWQREYSPKYASKTRPAVPRVFARVKTLVAIFVCVSPKSSDG